MRCNDSQAVPVTLGAWQFCWCLNTNRNRNLNLNLALVSDSSVFGALFLSRRDPRECDQGSAADQSDEHLDHSLPNLIP